MLIQELERVRFQGENSIKSLDAKGKEASEKVSHLQSALVVCQEELRVHINQLDDIRTKHDQELASKNKEV